ncbi:hypothetical protein CROQUDRAFT_687237, partial [Cronartium quercuum f. sp. fusiforme G11]
KSTGGKASHKKLATKGVKNTSGVKAPYRDRSAIILGTITLQETRKLQNYTGLLLKKLPHKRSRCSIAKKKKSALMALKESIEDYLMGTAKIFVSDGPIRSSINAERVTLRPKDIQLSPRL